LRLAAKGSKKGPQARRLLFLAAIFRVVTRARAAEIGGVTRQIIRDWVVKFNSLGPDDLIYRKQPGQPSRFNNTCRQALAAIVESGPILGIHGVVRWRIVDLCQWLFEKFKLVIFKQTLSRELRVLDIASSPRVPSIMLRPMAPLKNIKKTANPSQGNRA